MPGNYTAIVSDGRSNDTCSVTVTAAPVQPQSFTVSVANFCVGSPATYQFTGTANLAGSAIKSSTVFTPVGGNSQTINNGTIGTFVGSNGIATFSTTGHIWTTSDIGHYIRTFNAGSAASQNAIFDVINCNPVIPPATLICNPNNQTAAINQPANFSAIGGSGTYTWTAPGSTRTSGSGANFSTSYNSSGNYSATVSDGSQTAVCGVLVPAVQTQQLQCVPPSQTANANSTVYFSAIGGNGQYIWSAPNGSVTSGNGNTFTTAYNGNGGSYQTATVTSGDGQTASCNVTILTVQPAQLICSPVTQTANVNNPVYFSAFGGNGNISWSAPGSTNSNGGGSSFNTTYNSSGSYNVTFSSGSQTATCNVQVNSINIQQNGYLLINKWVAHVNQNDFSSGITVNSGDRVTYKIQVSAQNALVNNVILSDYYSLPGNASYINGTLRLNGSNQSDSWFNSMNLGTLQPGQNSTVTFDAYITALPGQNQTQITNTAQASGQNAPSVSATATVTINQQQVFNNNVNLSLSKRAINNTKNADATQVIASKEDYITYTLTAANNSNSPANNFVITDDLSQVLPYADVTDFGGGNLSGNVITFPAQTVPANGSVSVSFEVRVKYFLADNLSYTMNNTYGNTVTIRINTPPVSNYVAPKTGADTDAFAFGGLLVAGFALYRKKNLLTKLILN